MSEIDTSLVNESIKTYLRIKPLNNQNHNDTSNYLRIFNNNKCLSFSLSQDNKIECNFDNIFCQEDNQKKIFEDIGKPLCQSVLQGYNSTIISYGKKNTGKTYCLLGKSLQDIQNELPDNTNMNEIYLEYLNNKGLIIFCIEYIYNNLLLNPDFNNYSFNISLSNIEVFDNNILDYFNINNFKENKKDFNLDYLFTKKDSTDSNFTKLNVSSSDQALFLINQGLELRKLIFNEINLKGMNGHTIITLFIEKMDKETNQTYKSSFNFVELSSSSNVVNNYNLSLNKSLEIFSYIINQLSDNVKRDNISYSKSLLTNILKESLGGNSKTSVIVNISPNENNNIESFQSLNFSTKFKTIFNCPKINEVILYDIDYSYYNEFLTKKERLKNEKNHLVNYLGNIHNYKMEKDREFGSKKIMNQSQNQNQNQIQKKKEKEEDLNKLSKNVNILNQEIENINNDITNKQKEKKNYFDKYSKIQISLFKKNKDIQEKQKQINDINNNTAEAQKLIINYEKENINIDSLILKKDLLYKENKLKNDEILNDMDREISSINIKINEKENKLKNLIEIYNNLLKEHETQNKMVNELKKTKEGLLEEEREKQQKIDENKNECNKIINKSEDIKKEIENKNNQFNNCQNNLNQYDEYENKTINIFKKFYYDNNKKEFENNNKYYEIQKYLTQKEKELEQINYCIDDINKKKFLSLSEQEKIKNKIINYEQEYKLVEDEIKMHNNQINKLQEKISILTLNLNDNNIIPIDKDNDALTEEKNNDINSSILSFDILSNNKNIENDLFMFKNNFNLELDQEKKRQLLDNKTKLLEMEKKENKSLKEKKNKIDNEIYQFKIKHNKDKSQNQYNLVKIEENMDRITEKEKNINNYQYYLNYNYNLIKDYLNETVKRETPNREKNVSMDQFKFLFNEFLEKNKKVDEEFEKIKKEFKENETEYRWTSKEVINTSLNNNPLLKNYEEIYTKNDSITQIQINAENNKRITMNNNRILNDVKNLSIYNGIYPNKRKINDVIKLIPENKKKLKEKNIDTFIYEDKNEEMFNNVNNEELNNIYLCSEKENNDIINYSTVSKPLLFKSKEKSKNNNPFRFKSPDKTKTENNGKKNKYKKNTSNYKVNFTNNLKKDGNNKTNIFSVLKETNGNKY